MSAELIAFTLPGEAVPWSRAGSNSGRSRVPTDALIALYAQHGTLDRVAAIVGLNRASVHERLKRAGYKAANPPPFSETELEIIRDYYTTTPAEQFSLKKLAASIGRPHTSVSKQARGLGLTNPTRPASTDGRASIKASSAGRWDRNPHPRGMMGKPQTDKCRAAVGQAAKLKWATDKAFGIGFMSDDARQRRSDQSLARANATPAKNCYSRCRSGKRNDLGEIHFRSAWEANYARYLNLLMKMKVVETWDYEPVTFWFEEIRRGVRSYKPDFGVRYRGETHVVYVEVKGWMDDKSKTKLKRMRKYHPTVKIELVGAKEYRGIANKWKGAIPTWE